MATNTNLSTTMSSPLLKNSDGTAMVTVGQVVTAAVGAAVLYLFIPSNKRKRLFN